MAKLICLLFLFQTLLWGRMELCDQELKVVDRAPHAFSFLVCASGFIDIEVSLYDGENLLPAPSIDQVKSGYLRYITTNPRIKQSQLGHVKDTPQYKLRIKDGVDTSTFLNKKDAYALTKEAYKKGIETGNFKFLADGSAKIKYDFGKDIGLSKNGNPLTQVTIQYSVKKNQMHGHPSGPEYR